jgi:cobaltochelatase CobS
MAIQPVSDDAHKQNLSATPDNGVKCEIDGVYVHSVDLYLRREYPDMTLAEYQRNFHGAEILSPSLKKRKTGDASALTVGHTATVTKLQPAHHEFMVTKKVFADVFNLGNAPAAKNARGEPIGLEIVTNPGDALVPYIPELDPNYIFPIDNLKAVMMGVALNKPTLIWGYHGTGKTTLIEQFCARTGRPFLRVQHTGNTEESHILGQYVLKSGQTEFQPGPLAQAMRDGLVYCADEYDFALPSGTSVYQPVLEGKALVIKDAPPEWRIVKPHKHFRFFATGNTNGGGDETGLYQGTQMHNAANYSRFGITVKMDWMPEAQEVGVVAAQGQIHQDDARKLRKFAEDVRNAYAKGDLGVVVSPRELINAAVLGRAMGGLWRQGLALAYTNRLNSTDSHVVQEFAQRIFGT